MKRVLYHCTHCGQPIRVGAKAKVKTTGEGPRFYCYSDQGVDCMADEEVAIRTMREMDSEQYEFDFDDRVAVRGED